MNIENNHLYTNESTGQPVNFGVPESRFNVRISLDSVCDNCGHDVHRQYWSTRAGIVTRFVCPCACRVMMRVFRPSQGLSNLLDSVGVEYD